MTLLEHMGIPLEVHLKSVCFKSMMSGLPTELAFELSGHQGAVRAVRFNSEFPEYETLINAHLLNFVCAENGNYCLTCGSDKTLRLWNPHKGLCIKTYMGHGAEVLDADA